MLPQPQRGWYDSTLSTARAKCDIYDCLVALVVVCRVLCAKVACATSNECFPDLYYAGRVWQLVEVPRSFSAQIWLYQRRADRVYGKRNVWRPSVYCPVRWYTHRDSSDSKASMRRGQRTFRPDNKEDRHTCFNAQFHSIHVNHSVSIQKCIIFHLLTIPGQLSLIGHTYYNY